MRVFIFFCLFLLNFEISFSQQEGDYIWQLGPSTYSQDEYAQSIIVNFNADTLTIDTFERGLFMGYFNASLCDNEGNLLVYSNGCQVRDGHHHLIPGSKDLSPGDFNIEWCNQEKLGYPIFEGGIFLPFYEDSLIDLFHQRLVVLGQPTRVFVDTLFYTQLIKDDNTYAVVKKSIPIIGGTLFPGNLEAVRTMDQEGWWLIQQVEDANKYYIFKLLNGEIDTILIQEIGDKCSDKAVAQSVFSPDGTRYARFTPKDQVYLFDFDRNTGQLSNYQKIFVKDTNDFSGLAFSGNGRFLYASTTLDVYQFDIDDPNIEASKIHIGHFDGYGDPFGTRFYLMQLGPDCRIYINTTNGNKAWHVIQKPDEKGLACNLEQHAIQFPVSNSITMPNFPIFRSDSPEKCNPNIKTSVSFLDFEISNMSVYPNPVSDLLYIGFDENAKNSSVAFIQIFDQMGKLLKMEKQEVSQSKLTVNFSGFHPGMYLLKIKTEVSQQTRLVVKI